MAKGRVLHTMFRVGDLDRSIKFYTEVMGMELLRQHENEDYKYTLAFVGYGDESKGAVIELTYLRPLLSSAAFKILRLRSSWKILSQSSNTTTLPLSAMP